MTNDLINKKMIFLDTKFDNKDQIINYILSVAEKEKLITNQNDLKKAIVDRENQVSTAVGFEVAIPHGKSKSVNKPFISFLRTDKSIRWSKENSETVKMIILIAIPEGDVDNTHLKIISRISRSLLNDVFREKLSLEKNKEKIYQMLTLIDQK
ncbi:PTS sugar transporter subunit IIA [Facklamia sp. P12934]|uniref:PTS sugar transporter subunit IIA n=1 Tax=Facklamia sp. P12934 TaxID=3421948 RepID=UPI003D16DAC4